MQELYRQRLYDFGYNWLVAKKKKKQQSNSHYHLLKKAWLRRHRKVKREFHQKHKEALDFVIDKFPAKEKLASGAVGALMLSSVVPSPAVIGAIGSIADEPPQEVKVDQTPQLLAELNTVVGEKVRLLSDVEEASAAATLSKYFQMDVKSDIDGLRLNRTYGIIGAEQHLMRYPGDTMATHLLPEEKGDKMIYSSGMAPGRGAWGYFADSKTGFTQKDAEREKWYIAVQTFAAPNYNGRLADYRDFFKYRKMLVVNTQTGEAVVADIADSGPAIWTGKHLGGSPEVMYNLGFGKSRKGAVLYFFVNDPDDTIPLGPISLK